MEFGDMFYGGSPVMREKVTEKLFRQSCLASINPSEPPLLTCFLTGFANWVFSAKQDTILSLANCLFSWNMKINLQMTKKGTENNIPVELTVFDLDTQQMWSESFRNLCADVVHINNMIFASCMKIFFTMYRAAGR